MAGNIQDLNLIKFENEIREYEGLASILEMYIRNIYNNLKRFPTYWSGKRANVVISKWNNSYKTINSQMFYFTRTMSTLLWEMRDQYQAMEQGTPKKSNRKSWTGAELNSVPLSNSSIIKFEQTQAKQIISGISTNGTNVNATIKKMINKLNGMQNYSDSLKKLVTTYNENATRLQRSIISLINSIQDEAQKAYNDTTTTEAYNETDVKRAK